MKTALGTQGLIAEDNRKIVCFEENGREYVANNTSTKNLVLYKVDDGLISGHTRKCDYALGLPDEDIINLVELKGSHLKDAAEQLTQTIYSLGGKLTGLVVNARAVCSRVQSPDLRSSQVRRLEIEVAKRKGSFVKKSGKLIENI